MPALWIDGGIHAREWISPASAMYLLMELVENDADHPELTENLVWYNMLSVLKSYRFCCKVYPPCN